MFINTISEQTINKCFKNVNGTPLETDFIPKVRHFDLVFGKLEDRLKKQFAPLLKKNGSGEHEFNDFLQILKSLKHNLLATWYYYNNLLAHCRRIEMELKREVVKYSDAVGGFTKSAPEIFFEFEAFLLKVKISLDNIACFLCNSITYKNNIHGIRELANVLTNFTKNTKPKKNIKALKLIKLINNNGLIEYRCTTFF